MNLQRYNKAILAGIPVAILILNQVLPLTAGNDKLYVNAALGVLAVVAVIFGPANAEPSAPSLPPKP